MQRVAEGASLDNGSDTRNAIDIKTELQYLQVRPRQITSFWHKSDFFNKYNIPTMEGILPYPWYAFH